MKENFGIRFNLHKSGFAFKDDADVFSKMFQISREEAENSIEFCKQTVAEVAEKLILNPQEELALEKLKTKKIAFFGDSITSDRMSYREIIACRLGGCCADCAISGGTSTTLIYGFLDALIEHQPDFVHIMIGTNDSTMLGSRREVNFVSLSEYERNLRYMLQNCKDKGIKVIISTIPPVEEEIFHQMFGGYKNQENGNIKKYNEVIKQLCAEYGARLNDMEERYAAQDPRILHEPDGVHLSPAGQAVLAEAVLRKLIEAAGE